VNWSGRLGESDFLSRIFDLKNLPSYDHRQKNMAGDMHREHFESTALPRRNISEFSL
jgi:hypothetical protein